MTKLATEQQTLDAVLERLPTIERRAGTLLRRLERHVRLEPGARILEIGAAQGVYMAALQRAGYRPSGVEPWPPAVEIGRQVGTRLGFQLDLVEGVAEELPWPDGSFDLVLAISVLEHVTDPRRVMAEAARVLRPGGGFYFYTCSAVCPRQSEIRGFPAFGWYPQRLKVRIMDWAAANKPELIGGTTRPAYHWYTPWGTRSMLRTAGFDRVLDRWDLKLPDEVAGVRRAILRAAQRSAALRLAGDVALPECAYLALKREP
jgi:SAM-dependent methyltransferase